MNFEKRRQEVNRIDKSKLVPDRHVLVSMIILNFILLNITV